MPLNSKVRDKIYPNCKLIIADQVTTAVATPSWVTLAVLLNCEYQLYVLNESTPLRLNPFLSHWVEAIQRLSVAPPNSPSRPATPKARNNNSITSADIFTTRVELVKSLLKAHDSKHVATLSPSVLFNKHVEQRHVTPFDIGVYIQMLEEEGIYEKASVDGASRNSHPENHDAPYPSPPKSGTKQDWKQSLLSRLETDPESALPDLTRLSLELSSLDFLTTLLQNHTLQSLSIDPSPVIHDFLQHSLRLIEQMGQPAGTNLLNHTSSFGPSGALKQGSALVILRRKFIRRQ